MIDFSERVAGLRQLAELPSDTLFDTRDASRVLALLGASRTPKTLAKLRCVQTNGPRWRRVGSSVRYTLEDLRTFASGS